LVSKIFFYRKLLRKICLKNLRGSNLSSQTRQWKLAQFLKVLPNVWLVWFMMFNATLNNISVISWWSVLLVEETGVPRENHRPVASH